MIHKLGPADSSNSSMNQDHTCLDVDEGKVVEKPFATTELPIDDTKSASSEVTGAHITEEEQYPPFKALILIMVALYLAMFLVALDRTIIAVAIPRITDTFHSLDDIGWYGSSYMLTNCAFQLIFGKFYTFYSPKWVFLTVVGIFEVGSAICGAAPNTTTFIIGRAIAGLGSSGVMAGTIVIIMHSVPLRKRPMWTGFMGAIFGIASVAGPLLGGVFTSKVSWRWCFYINLPIGGVAFALIFFILKLPNPKEKKSIRQKIDQLDPIGTILFLPGIVCLLLALQLGGSTYAWGNARIIALLILFPVLMSAYLFVQHWKGDTATVPPRIIKNRSIAAGIWFTFFSASSMMASVYYLPVWFQAIKGVNAVHSGIDMIPFIMGLVVASIFAGSMVTRFGYFTPFMIAGSIIQSIGAGLITTFTVSTGHPKWIGYQVLYGLGIGMGMQQSGMAANTVLAKKDIPTGVSLMFFGQQLGGAVFVSIGGNVFANELISGLRHIPGIDIHGIINTGATEIKRVVDPKYLNSVLHAYNGALVKVFDVAVAVSCATIIGAALMEWKSVKKANPAGKSGPLKVEEEEGRKKMSEKKEGDNIV